MQRTRPMYGPVRREATVVNFSDLDSDVVSNIHTVSGDSDVGTQLDV